MNAPFSLIIIGFVVVNGSLLFTILSSMWKALNSEQDFMYEFSRSTDSMPIAAIGGCLMVAGGLGMFAANQGWIS